MSQGLSRLPNIDQALIVDETSTPDTIYIGYAEIGAATSSAVWKVKRIVTTGGATITWADGDDNYDNIWDDRTTLTYS